MDLLIETINDNYIGWKADKCKLQKHHAQYCEDEGVNLAQTSSTGQLQFGQGPEWKKTLEQAQKYQKQYASYDQIPDAEIPQ